MLESDPALIYRGYDFVDTRIAEANIHATNLQLDIVGYLDKEEPS